MSSPEYEHKNYRNIEAIRQDLAEMNKRLEYIDSATDMMHEALAEYVSKQLHDDHVEINATIRKAIEEKRHDRQTRRN